MTISISTNACVDQCEVAEKHLSIAIDVIEKAAFKRGLDYAIQLIDIKMNELPPDVSVLSNTSAHVIESMKGILTETKVGLIACRNLWTK